MEFDPSFIPQLGAFVAAALAAYIAFRKAPAENEKLAAEVELTRADTQGHIIEDLTRELERQQAAVAEMERRLENEIEQMRQAHLAEKRTLQAEITELRDLNLKLQRRIVALETET